MYFNKAIIIGNLTRDPELRTLPAGTPVASFGMATNRVWRDKAGEKKEDTQFHNIVVFGSQASNVSQYLRKGSSVLVEGRMQTRSWDSPEGKKYRTEIIAERVQFGPKSTGMPMPKEDNQSKSKNVSKDKEEKGLATIEYPEDEINPEDIPF